MTQSLVDSARDFREHTIKDFLQRPLPLANFEWKTTDPQFQILSNYSFPDEILAVPLYQQKLYGFLGIRADLKFRLQINSQPFQAGRLMLQWIPYDKYLGDRVTLWTQSSEAAMVASSALPRIEMDVSQQTECTLHVPFASPNVFYNLATGEGYYGTLLIRVYSPLVDPTGGGKVDCTLWFSFENPQLAFPTGTSIASSSVGPRAQVGLEEKQMEESRCLSNSLGHFSSALKTFPDVPLISQIRQPLTWALDSSAAVAKISGFSKPETLNVPALMKQTPTHFMANYDGVNLSHSLGLAAENSVEALPGMVGTDVDEMNLGHVMRTPCYVGHFSWSTSAANGAVLYSNPIHPLAFGVTVPSSTSDVAKAVPLISYVTALCAFWRGSIDITFKFVKTKFHSGRVRIFFQPGKVDAFQSVNSNYNYSQVVDLRSEDTVVFRVPYVSTKPWMYTTPSNSTTGELHFTGLLHVEVLNELMATSTVSGTIDVLVEISAGPDYEIAAPSQSLYQPTRIVGSSTSLLKRLRIKAQVGEELNRETEQTIINKDQLGSKGTGSSWLNNTSMIGEKLVSVRQLIKRSQKVSVFTPGTTNIVSPWRFVDAQTRVISTPATPTDFGYLDYLAQIYGFYRGSVNLKFVPSDFQTTRASIEALVNRNDASPILSNNIVTTSTPLSANQMRNGGVQIVFQDIEGCIDVHIPYYSNVHMCPVTNLPQNIDNQNLSLFPQLLLVLENLSATATYKIFRSGGDSFQFGYLLGTPLVSYMGNT